MAENDALSTFDFSKVTGGGLYLKFEAGKALTLRVLTVDPVVYNDEFEDKETGEISLNTRFAFIVYNFTDKKAQILQTTPNMAKKIGDLHKDPDFGSDIRKIDIKITPTGEKLQRRYDIQVLPNAQTLTKDMVEEAKAIDLDDQLKEKNGQRMSFFDPDKSTTPGHDKAAAIAEEIKNRNESFDEDEPINLDDIPF